MAALLLGCSALTATAVLAAPAAAHPGCEGIDARQCVGLALTAVGGRERLAAIANARFDIAEHTALTEQSYRQAPFITAYERDQVTLDFAGKRQRTDGKALWPESDPGTDQAESAVSVVSIPSRERLELGPERLLLTASAAADLHYLPAETLRSTRHAVVAFAWNGTTVKVLLNADNHLPDAVESTQVFGGDFWFAWGDVAQRVYFDNWKLIGGVLYPTNRIEERNGVLWDSAQVLDLKFNVPLDEKQMALPASAAQQAARPFRWERPFDASHHVALAPGVDLYQGSWNMTFVKQADGIVVLEAPISPFFAQQALAKARADNPGVAIKAVLSTSDSWPHFAGVRQAVAEKLPVYVLDLNRDLVDRAVHAPHALHPDQQQTAPQPAQLRVVSGRLELGSGPNRMVLYPLRGAATERQYMVYFPEHRLLYASDTLSLDDKTHALYDPELMHEVVQAVDREHLAVDRVFAMHQAPTPWADVVRQVEAALKA
ncbi:hypothetical protein [Phenylobacterium sp.]|uniref:hypothetical protein n=1 Tax=Phenylobacterium sp. TaxID=1871053 RepID=UPI0012092452|nr:hypothetical protein [Phenylobacterium sp.]THD59319.1 MAG: hypothetical protein E8A49_16655 [Phenylobacterium sp.]